MSRNMTYLNNNNIIYRRDPISDKPTEVYEWGYYYEHGTHTNAIHCFEVKQR